MNVEIRDDDVELPAKGWFWLSFADPHLPVGTQFLGVAIVEIEPTKADVLLAKMFRLGRHPDPFGPMEPEALEIYCAVSKAHELEINPGGEVQAFRIPEEHLPPESFRNRLCQRAELEAAGLA